MEKETKKQQISMEYNEIKQKALNNPLVRILVRLSEIRIVSEGIITYKGKELRLTENAFHALAKFVGAPLQFQRNVGTLLGDQARVHFMNTMRDALSARKDKQLMFIGNPEHSTIVGVSEEQGMLSAQSFFDLTEGIITKYGLEVKTCSIDAIGAVSITTTSTQEATIKGLPLGHKDSEDYLPGLSFQNSVISGTKLNPFTYRLVCTNGMIGKEEGKAIEISGFDSKELKKFYDRVKALANNNFVSFDYNERVLSAINNFASLGELKFAADLIGRTSTAGHKTINAFVPYYSCVEKYAKLGLDAEKFSTKQLANAKTNVPVWDVVNALTNYGSHAFDGVEMTPAARALVAGHAGLLLNKKAFDTEFLVPSLI